MVPEGLIERLAQRQEVELATWVSGRSELQAGLIANVLRCECAS